MFNNTSTIKPNNEINNNQNIILDLDLQGRNARIEMSSDEWYDVQNIVSKQSSNSTSGQMFILPMIFHGRAAQLNLNKKEYKFLQETILILAYNDPKKTKDKITMEMNINNRPARVEMRKAEMARWLCLIESIDLIEKKCSEMNVTMSEDFWIQPIAMQKYMDSRFETMMDEVNHHEFGIDTKSANMDILKKKRNLERMEEVETEEEFDPRYVSVCTS